MTDSLHKAVLKCIEDYNGEAKHCRIILKEVNLTKSLNYFKSVNSNNLT